MKFIKWLKSFFVTEDPKAGSTWYYVDVDTNPFLDNVNKIHIHAVKEKWVKWKYVGGVNFQYAKLKNFHRNYKEFKDEQQTV